MGGVKRVVSLSCLLLVILFSQSASAATDPILPESSFYEGSTYYDRTIDGKHLYGRIDFAVYDTLGVNEFVNIGGFTAPGTGQYIYAYQIFNDYDGSEGLSESEETVAYFAVFGPGEDPPPMDVDEDSIGSQDDGQGGIKPDDDDCYFTPSHKKAVWEFGGNEGYVYTGKHSAILVYSSNGAPVTGQYEIRAPQADELWVAGEVPEPATIVLLGIGGSILFRKRRKI